MKREEIQEKIKFHEGEIRFLQGIKTNCLNCAQFNEKSCKKHGIVPDEFQRDESCPDWVYDDVPF